ncbi:hypothetical protein [Clostridium perfringens]|uniref:hypothetical protein n=1 Tax=Clostridium perfringens TaxID=1502 RepID=UPI002B21EFB7|nr:hypothetical protein [Clostridium perfringens]MEA5268969.1 hypothetical protein [Clostridium perfringens]MEA5271575.1 hypothetical protein [Clostridium perfringens]MEA5342129.1 hypothetical protein [Clostridium perfringens]MEA5380614.1 hypothetical protein [Clostridium perfringens]
MEEKLSKAEEEFINQLQEHINRDPEEIKEAVNQNRQQRKQHLRNQEKRLRAVRKLTPVQIEVMKEIITKEKEKSQNTVAEYTMSLYSSVNSVLYSDFNFNGDESVKLWEAEPYEIVFKKHAFKARDIRKKIVCGSDLFFDLDELLMGCVGDTFEVIGNTYDNPELEGWN